MGISFSIFAGPFGSATFIRSEDLFDFIGRHLLVRESSERVQRVKPADGQRCRVFTDVDSRLAERGWVAEDRTSGESDPRVATRARVRWSAGLKRPKPLLPRGELIREVQ